MHEQSSSPYFVWFRGAWEGRGDLGGPGRCWAVWRVFKGSWKRRGGSAIGVGIIAKELGVGRKDGKGHRMRRGRVRKRRCEKTRWEPCAQGSGGQCCMGSR